MIVIVDLQRAEADLAAGEPACPVGLENAMQCPDLRSS
jgi:hypothetical protein